MTRIATFNLNGVNGRLPVLIKWLGQTDYDIVCLQELKTSDEKFPRKPSGTPVTARSGTGKSPTTA
jgi:exodeoxyribonuclease III